MKGKGGDSGRGFAVLGDDDFRFTRSETDIVPGAGVEFADGDLDRGHA